MRFGEHFLEELKTRLRPSDVIGRHVKLKRQGREYAGLSPFTNEKTPSFFVNDEKGFYHCFSSGKHGDIISFLMEVNGLSFPEAVEYLAGQAGMPLPKEDPKAEARAKRNSVVVNWMEAAHEFFMRSLRSDAALEARQYLKKRGLSPDDIKRFGIGYAPDSFGALRDHLITKGAMPDMLIEAGLLIEPDDKSREPWDRFRDRIMFPIHDPRGRLVGFGGRALSPDAKAKYLNSPETPLFHKGQVLYNYGPARKSLADAGNPARGMIVAEGYMDVIALARGGLDYAVAPLGTALTADQMQLLWRSGPEPMICFDGDSAGQRAAYRVVETALPLLRPGYSVRFALLPAGRDPDDIINASGRQGMVDILAKSIPLVDMLWQRELTAEPVETPEDRAGLKNRLYTALREIKDEAVREQYKTALMDRFYSQFSKRAQYSGGAAKRPSRFISPQQKQAMQSEALMEARERRVVGAIFEFPELLAAADQMFFALRLRSEDLRRLQSALLNYLKHTNKVEKSALTAHIETQGLEAELKELMRSRRLVRAALGGSDASLDERQALWFKEAEAIRNQTSENHIHEDSRERLADSIRDDNAEALSRLMRLELRRQAE